MSQFLPAPSELFYSRDPDKDPRLGDCVERLTDLKPVEGSFVLAGFPDDEGIRNNKGREGAKFGPDRIRFHLYRMTPNVLSQRMPRLIDFGNFDIEDVDLINRHAIASHRAHSMLERGVRWVSLGGGHDYGYADGKAICELAKQEGQRPIVINFDAHLDVRETTDKINSGTAFRRLLEEYPDLDFYEIGIQAQCNAREHYDWVLAKNGQILSLTQIISSGESASTVMLRFLEGALTRRRLTYVSLDMDVLSSAFSPGTSQSFASGLWPWDLFRTLDVIFARLDVRMFGVYETSPPLDVADSTSKLAAEFIHQYISHA